MASTDHKRDHVQMSGRTNLAPALLIGHHTYEDMVLPKYITASNLERVKTYRFQGDVVIASYPKTGSTWIHEMTWLIMNNGDTEVARKKDTFTRIPYLESCCIKTDVPTLDMLDTMPRPLTFKCHLPARFFTKHLSEDDVKFLIQVRNPKDTLVSYYHYYRANKTCGLYKGTWDEFFEMFTEKSLRHGDFFNWYRSWWALEDHPQVLFVKYEDMKHNLYKEVKRICQFLDKQLPEDIIENIVSHGSFHAMKGNRMANWGTNDNYQHDISPFMRSGQIGDWKNYFTKEQSNIMDKIYTAEMQSNGLLLDFE